MEKLRLAINLIGLLKNWPTFFLDYLGVYKHRHITYVLNNGIKYKTRSGEVDSLLIADIWIRKMYTPPDFRIRKHDIVVDIGAHIGIFSLFAAAQAKGGRIYSYEPDPENFDLLQQNIKINSTENIALFRLGLSGKKEIRQLFLSSQRKTEHSIYIEAENSVDIRCVTLKDVFDENRLGEIDLLKMDCEGAEYEVLFNTPQNYLRRIRKISLEYHDGVMGHNHQELKYFLESRGFDTTTETFSFQKNTSWGMMYGRNRNR